MVLKILITSHSFAVEFNPRPNGRINLRVNNYNFFKHKKTIGSAYRWSCTSYGSKKRCKAHLIIDENLQVLKANIVHNHVIGERKKKRNSKKMKPAKHISKKGKVDHSFTEETDVSKVTTNEVTNKELNQVQNVSPSGSLIMSANDKIETDVKDRKEKNIKVAKKDSKKDETKTSSKENSDYTNTDTEVPCVTSTEITNLVSKQLQEVNSPEALIVLDDDNIETDIKDSNEKNIKVVKKELKKVVAKISSKEDSDNTNTNAEVPCVTSTKITNHESKQLQEVDSPEAFVVSDDDNIETDNKKGKEKKITVATKTSKEDKSAMMSKEESNMEIKATRPVVTTTNESNVDLIQVHDVDSPDEPIVLDDD